MPQAVATARSRRRCDHVSLGFEALIVRLLRLSWLRSSWLVQHARPLHQRDDIEQDDERAERERDRDRTGAPFAFLFLGEDDPFRFVVHVFTPTLTPTHGRGGRPLGPRSGGRRTERRDRGLKSRRAAWPIAPRARRSLRPKGARPMPPS